jgi:ABC-2 type transport system ATP-binding protein
MVGLPGANGAGENHYTQAHGRFVISFGWHILLKKPVGNLSLGERMKCELAAGLLYRPGVQFLDEPILGLNVLMLHRFRGIYKSEFRQVYLSR